jgi:transcriptional regulator with XRE-family HTH domain
MRFGERLRGLRHDRGLLLENVATAMRLSAAYLSQIETGRKNPPSPSKIKKLCMILECEARVSELLRLAKLSRVERAVILRTDFRTAPEVRAALSSLERSYRTGKFTVPMAQKIKRILEENTAAA